MGLISTQLNFHRIDTPSVGGEREAIAHFVSLRFTSDQNLFEFCSHAFFSFMIFLHFPKANQACNNLYITCIQWSLGIMKKMIYRVCLASAMFQVRYLIIIKFLVVLFGAVIELLAKLDLCWLIWLCLWSRKCSKAPSPSSTPWTTKAGFTDSICCR